MLMNLLFSTLTRIAMNIFGAICLFLLKTGDAFTLSTLHKVHHQVAKSNALFTQSSDDDLREIQDAVGLTDTELKRIASRVPQINEYNAAASKVCIENLKNRLSVSDIEFKKKIVLRLPQCLGYNFESDIDPSLSMLQNQLNLSDEELRSLVLKCPQIIGLDYLEDVEPKVNAVQAKIGGDLDAVKAEILGKPASLDLPVRGGVSSNRN